MNAGSAYDFMTMARRVHFYLLLFTSSSVLPRWVWFYLVWLLKSRGCILNVPCCIHNNYNIAFNTHRDHTSSDGARQNADSAMKY